MAWYGMAWYGMVGVILPIPKYTTTHHQQYQMIGRLG